MVSSSLRMGTERCVLRPEDQVPFFNTQLPAPAQRGSRWSKATGAMRKHWYQGENSPPIPRRKSSSPGHSLSLHIHVVFSRWRYSTRIVTTSLGNTTRSKASVLEFICAYLNRAEWRKTLFFPLASSNSWFKPTAYSKSSRITQSRTTKKIIWRKSASLQTKCTFRDCEGKVTFVFPLTTLYLATKILQHRFLQKCAF